MVKVGFIVEGATEKLVVESAGFRSWCRDLGIEVVEPVIDAQGSGNLLPANIEIYLDRLRLSIPDKIAVITDLEDGPDRDAVRARIDNSGLDHIFVAVKAIEAWFLADSEALRSWLGRPHVETNPEETPALPWERIRSLATEYQCRGPGPSKPVFARRYLATHGFLVARAAEHLRCPSAQDLRDTLRSWGTTVSVHSDAGALDPAL